MTLALKNVVKRVGAEIHIYDTSVEFSDQGFNILLGTTLAGQDHTDAADGRSRETDLGRDLVRRQGT